MSLASGTRLGQYRVLSELGAGGMGEVYRARDTKLDRDVAVKVLPDAFSHDPERLARFEREARCWPRSTIPNIAAIYGLEESGGTHALVMELVEGEDCSRDHSRAGARVTPISSEALPIARQVADALEAAHEQRHRPPRSQAGEHQGPGRRHGESARLRSRQGASRPAEAQARRPGPGEFADDDVARDDGRWASSSAPRPTWRRSRRRAGRWTAARDIWAFGCVLYEMLSGRKAFDGETVTDVLAAVIMKEPDWSAMPQTTPPAIRRLIRRCLQKDVRHRLQAIGEARIAIEDVLERRGTRRARARQIGMRPPRGARVAAVTARPLAACCPGRSPACWPSRWSSWRPSGSSARPPCSRFRCVAYVPPPSNTTFRDFGFGAGPVVVSPDGRQLAFSATDQSGVTTLYVRPLASDNAGRSPAPKMPDRRSGRRTAARSALSPTES